MDHLHFLSLPQELKNYVFSYIDLFESIKFLKINKFLRNQILFKGPFPKNLQELKITTEVIEFENTNNVQFWIPGFRLKLTTTDYEEISFVFTESLLTVEHQEKPFYAEKPFFLFNLITGCQSIHIDLQHDEECETKITEHFLQNLFKVKFLPKLKSILNLKLESFISEKALKNFLTNFSQKVLKICIFDFIDLSEFDEDCFENFLETTEISKVPLVFLTVNRGMILPIVSPEVVIHYTDDEYFVRVIEEYLDDGVRCKNPDVATIVFTNERIPNHFSMSEFFNWVIDSAMNYAMENGFIFEIVEEDLEELKPFLDFFMKKFESFGGEFIQGFPYIVENAKFDNFSSLKRDYDYKLMLKKEEPSAKSMYYMISLEENDERHCTMQLLMKRF